MTEDQLKPMIRRIGEYFGLDKAVLLTRFEQWYGRVKDIPAEALPYIETCIQDHHDSMPRNMPKYIRGYYYAWKSANTAKLIDYPRTTCAECHGHGLIWIKRTAMIEGKPWGNINGPITEETSYRCASCENWKRHCHADAKPAATRQYLADQGHDVLFNS